MQSAQITLPVGTVIQDRYIVERLLGQGGGGAVYLVRDQRSRGNLFALKELIDQNKQDRKRFIFEGELLTRLDHPSLLRVYRLFDDETNGRIYMLMDYVDGPNLETVRQQQPGKRFSLSEVLNLVGPIMDAVAYLHNQHPSILHRDIKPSNILMPADGKPVLVDFGLAKQYAPDSTTAAVRRCSPGYGAPEQYSGGTRRQTDIYGLGATLYTLLTGIVPADAFRRVTAVSNGSPDPLRPINQLVPDIPQSVAEAIHRAMSLDSNDRFSTFDQFWQALHTPSTQTNDPGTQSSAIPPALSSTPLPPPIISYQSVGATLRGLPAAMQSRRKRSRVRQARPSRKAGPLLLIPLALLLILGLGVVLWAALGNQFSAPPSSFIPKPSSTTSIASPTSNPTAQPTPQPTTGPSPLPDPTPPPSSGALPGSHPTPGLTPTVQPTPAPTPAPAPTPTLVSYIAGNYNGTIDDTTANIITGMALSIQQTPGQKTITGTFTVNPPLEGNGSFTGTVNSVKYVQFTVAAYHSNAPLYFWGWVQADGSIKGDYCSLNSQNLCDPKAGAAGTWVVDDPS